MELNWGAVTSAKKQTKHTQGIVFWVLFPKNEQSTLRIVSRVRFVYFLGQVTARQFCFKISLVSTSLLVCDVLDNFCLANIKCVKPQCMSTSVLSYSSPLTLIWRKLTWRVFIVVKFSKNVFGVRSAQLELQSHTS